MARKRITEVSKGVGRPKVGGPVTGLVDQWNRQRKDEEFLGKYRLVSHLRSA
jgi:protein SCO1/2